MNIGIIIPTHMPTKPVKLDRSRKFQDIWRDMPIFAVLRKKLSFFTELILTKIIQDAEKFMPFNLLKSELRYCNLLRNSSVTKEIGL